MPSPSSPDALFPPWCTPQAVAQYKAEQVVKRQKANAQQVCLTIPVTTAERRRLQLDDSRLQRVGQPRHQPGEPDTGFWIDQDLTALRAANERKRPASGPEDATGKMITAREAQRAAVASRNISSMNSTAREMNSAA